MRPHTIEGKRSGKTIRYIVVPTRIIDGERVYLVDTDLPYETQDAIYSWCKTYESPIIPLETYNRLTNYA